jgi:dienelactone hydrolase
MRARCLWAGHVLGLVNLFVLSACGCIAAGSPSEERVLQAPEKGGKSPGALLHDYLLDQARQQFDLRRKGIAAMKTPDAIARRQGSLKTFFLGSLGDLPERAPLYPRVVGTLMCDGYRVEKVIFESRPNHHVTANLYLPEAAAPFPGVLLPCGHADNGKAWKEYQRVCILLAKNGMAVLCYDPIGQGERFQLLDEQGKPVVRGTNEHTMAGIGALLIGRQLASYRVWDGMRALDYLASRPEIDPKRLGCTGNSGGGTMTAYLMALDDRIAVAAPSCYITSLERLFATIGPQDAEQNITDQVAVGMEHADYLTMRAPKPTLMTVGTRDFFDITGSWDTFREVKLIYGRLGFGERVDLFESDEPHGFTQPRRVATARWMRRWLLEKDDAVDEPDFPIASDAELQCTPSGQVMRDFPDQSVFDLNRQRERELAAARAAARAGRSEEELRAVVARRLGLGAPKLARVTPREVATETSGDLVLRKLAFDVEPLVVISALELTAQRAGKPGPTIVKVGASWKDEVEHARETLKRGGWAGRIVLLDPRGMGEPTDRAGEGDLGSPFGRDWKEAFMALHLGRPLVGQRAVDILTVLESLASEASGEPPPGFVLEGTGLAGPVVLHAASLDRHGRIKSVALRRSLVSWSDVIERKISRDQLSSVVPGALLDYDLPDLAAELAPLPLSIQEPLDAAGKPVAQQTLDQAYAACKRAYGSRGTLELRATQGLTPSR